MSASRFWTMINSEILITRGGGSGKDKTKGGGSGGGGGGGNKGGGGWSGRGGGGWGKGGGGGAGDPFGSDVQLLLNFDGTHLGTDAGDEGQNEYALVYGGNAKLSNALTFSADYGTSLLLDGNGDNVRIAPNVSGLWLGSGAFTWEIRFYLSSAVVQHIYGFEGSGTANDSYFFSVSGGSLQFTDKRSGSKLARVTVGTANTGVWLEIAITYDGAGNYTSFRNGAVINTGFQTGTNPNPNGNFSIGEDAAGFSDLNGRIQAMRFTSVDRYGGEAYEPFDGKWAL